MDVLPPFDPNRDHFALFGLPATFRLERTVLEQAYRDLQSLVHPDRFAHLPDSDKRLSMQWAARVNEAYQTLRTPLSRARYLLHLRGVDAGLESNTAMPMAFLVEQMEWREAVMEARAGEDADGLEHLHHRVSAQLDAHYRQLQEELDGTPAAEAAGTAAHNEAAAATVRRLMFLEKLRQDIDDAIEALEG